MVMGFGNRKGGNKIFTFLNKISIQAGDLSEKDRGNVPGLTAAHEEWQGRVTTVCLYPN